MSARHLQESFAEKIRRDVVVLPGGWPTTDPTDTPDAAALSRRLDSAFADARRRWKKGPEAALEPLFTLHEELKLHPGFPNITPLAYYAAALFKATGPDLEEPGFGRWKSLIDVGLLDFCERVVRSDEVLSQIYQPWNLKFFEILESTFRTVHRSLQSLPDSGRDSPLLARVVSIANQLWRIIIDRPHAFVSTSWDSTSKASYQCMLARVIFAATPNIRELDPSGQSYRSPEYRPFHRVVLFAWMHGHDPEDDMGLVEMLLFTPYKDLWPAPFETPLDIPDDPPAEFTSFIQDEILGVYGPREFLDRLEISLRHPQNLNNRLLYLIKMIGKTILRQEFVPHIQAAGTLWSMRQAVDQQVMKGSKDDMQLFMIARHTLIICSLFSQISSISEGAAYLVKECDIIELLSFTVVLAVRIQPLVPLGYSGLSILSYPMQVWTELGAALSVRKGRNSLLKAYKHSVRREWYPTLAMLRTLPKAEISHDTHRDDVVQAWIELGMTVDLDEANERDEYERFGKRAARSCSWRDCRYHTETAPNPSRVCVGCGEVRYCGKSCQLKDWKEGQHKKRCKRIKDKPSVPRQTPRMYRFIQ